jgi:hypothetical protein
MLPLTYCAERILDSPAVLVKWSVFPTQKDPTRSPSGFERLDGLKTQQTTQVNLLLHHIDR